LVSVRVLVRVNVKVRGICFFSRGSALLSEVRAVETPAAERQPKHRVSHLPSVSVCQLLYILVDKYHCFHSYYPLTTKFALNQVMHGGFIIVVVTAENPDAEMPRTSNLCGIFQLEWKIWRCSKWAMARVS
jgi:hypothetical protein